MGLFWKLTGAATLLLVIAGIVFKFVTKPVDVIYLALGVCGILALIVVPLQMFVEDRNQRRM